MNKDNKKRIKRPMSQAQYIAAGFAMMVLIGACLLSLPMSSRTGEFTPFLDALFTAASSSCVTGLVVYDTYTHWSICGQIILIVLIQTGGLGFITIGVFFSIYFRRKIGLLERGRMQESVSALQIGGMVKLARFIVKGTFMIEGLGALLLSIVFVPRFGLVKGIYYSVFHSISAFCNAGFDLMGEMEPYSSFSAFAGDTLVNLVLVALILLGGLGFLVWEDVYVYRGNIKKYRLHSKLVLLGTVIFTVGGCILFWIFEKNTVLAGMTVKEQFLASLFGAVTPRTAGFNTTDSMGLSSAGIILNLFLMLAGGCPGSTAGGAKVTTIMVLYLFVANIMQRSDSVEIFGRRLSNEAIRKAAVVVTINVTLGVVAAVFICATQGFSIEDTLFETFSAINTVGITRNLTRELNSASRIVIMLLMYFGRVGSLTFAFSFLKKKNTDIIKCPVEEVLVG